MVKIALILTILVGITVPLQVFEVYEDATSNWVSYQITNSDNPQEIYDWLVLSSYREGNTLLPIEFYLDRGRNMNVIENMFEKYYAHKLIKKYVTMTLWGLCLVSWFLVECVALRPGKTSLSSSG